MSDKEILEEILRVFRKAEQAFSASNNSHMKEMMTETSKIGEQLLKRWEGEKK